MRKVLMVGAMAFVLSGCVGAIAGGGALGTAIAVASAAVPVLSDVAKAACAGQGAANAAGDAAAALGSPKAAADASEISTILGKVCAW